MPNPASSSSSRSFLWPAVIAAVVVAGLIAVVFARGSNSEAEQAVAEQQTSDVSVTGAPLPAATDTGPDDPAVGQAIPALSGTDFDGQPVEITPGDGAKVLMFVAHWCPVCQREVPVIADHVNDGALPDDVELVIVSTDVRRASGNFPPSSWLADEGWDGTVLADSESAAAASAFGLQSFPYFVVVDAEGQVAGRTSGEIGTDAFDQLVELART